ncbi:hypothetical protein GCM10020001_006900 [Nonomuraea salmonea]
MEELKDRAARLERAHAADTRAARAEERSRIARELHDVVAHHVSVMTVQAAAARRVLATDPELAREALSAVEHTGRLAMTEMRNIVGVLRTDAQAELGPQPAVRDLPALVELMREAGLPVRLQVEGAEVALPAGVDLAAYRTVQEALTNSLRHAGAGAKATVTVRYEPGELDVRVEDDGVGDGVGAAAGEPRSEGHGLVGIRERVTLYGGILNIGPLPGGRFRSAGPVPVEGRPMTIRVLLVDDQPLLRTGFRLILEAEPDITVVGQAGDGKDAQEQTRALLPDVVLMDIRMPGGSTASRRPAASCGRRRRPRTCRRCWC